MDYADLDRRVDAAAAALRGLGVGRGDRVALVMSNGVEMVVAIYAILRAGAAFSPVSPGVTAAKLGRILDDVGAAAVVCGSDTRELVSDAAPAGVEIVDDLAARAEDPGEGFAPMIGPDLAAVIYTSGSTGEPKGVTLTHGNMSFVADSIIESLGMEASDRVLCVLPLYFGYGLYQLLTCVRLGADAGARARFRGRGPDRPDPRRAADHRIRGGADDLPAADLAPGPARAGAAASALPHQRRSRRCRSRSSRAVREAFPDARLYLMYGQTECQRVCRLPPEEVDAQPFLGRRRDSRHRGVGRGRGRRGRRARERSAS